MSDLERQIRKLISAYVSGQVQLAEFQTSFSLLTWDVSEDDAGASRLAYDTELLIAEVTSGHRTDAELRTELGITLGTIEVQMPAPVRVTVRHESQGRWVLARPHGQASNAARHEAALA